MSDTKWLAGIMVRFEQKEDHYRVVFHRDANSAAILSPKGNLEDKSERRFILDCLFSALSHTLRQQVFPKDTLIFDTVETPTGVKCVNPRYPES